LLICGPSAAAIRITGIVKSLERTGIRAAADNIHVTCYGFLSLLCHT
jgi:hypothetical protein